MGFALKKEQLPHYTYEDYKLWEGRWELICGIPYAMSPSPVWRHQKTNVKIVSQLDGLFDICACKCVALMALDWIVNDDTIVEPDVSVTCEPIEGKFLTKTPEIIFEILSPSTTLKDKNTKYELYKLNGVKYYILVDAENKTYEIFELQNGEYKKVNAINNIFDFQIKNCSISFNFSTIWAD